MELYFFRHGIAVERTESLHDAERSLTLKGQQRTRQVARRLRGLGISFDGILTSPLLRAQQTADILCAEKLLQNKTFGDRPQLFPPLAPDGSLEEFLAWLKDWRPDTLEPKLVLVGHQPDLGEWAEAIAFGQKGTHLVLKKAGIIGIHCTTPVQLHHHNELFLLTSPKWLL